MKKLIPVLLFIMAFTGFLSTQILWDSFDLNAGLPEQDKQNYSVYEKNFQELKLTTTKNTTLELKKLSEPIVILNFWASWCLPCLKEFPGLVKFQERYKGKVKVLGINGDDDEKALELIRKVEGKHGLNFESVSDAKSVVSNQFMINTYPVSIIYLRGKVIYVNKKIHDFMNDEFLGMIDKSLN